MNAITSVPTLDKSESRSHTCTTLEPPKCDEAFYPRSSTILVLFNPGEYIVILYSLRPPHHPAGQSAESVQPDNSPVPEPGGAFHAESSVIGRGGNCLLMARAGAAGLGLASFFNFAMHDRRMQP
jgi:hypothetical protein